MVCRFYTVKLFSRWESLIQGWNPIHFALFGAVTAAFEYGVTLSGFRMLVRAHDKASESQFI